MKTIKVSIYDENTLVLMEGGQKGDLINLKSIHEKDFDKTTINTIIKSISNSEFEARVLEARQSYEKEKLHEVELKEKDLVNRAKEALAKKDQEIVALNTKIESIAKQIESESKLRSIQDQQKLEEAYRSKLGDKELEIQEVKHQKELLEQKYKDELKARDAALVSFKEMRSRMSTKMIGESLEVHCENEFNKIRPFAFPKAQLSKDNLVSASGSKGDYIYKESDDDGNEIISIMFEMKNEDETTATKHKNKDFFKELDKDRREKNCEYAVLVSLLEKENEYYDDIVTVSEYQNMFVIRPQHFITIIGFLRLGNLKSQDLRRTIHQLKNQNIDVTNFESNMNSFKESFSRNYNLASEQFAKAIEEVDKTIDHLNKVKENLLKSDNNLRLANNKASELSIKKLTTNSPSVALAFEEKAKNSSGLI